jgi:hypothetical protein
MVRYEIGDQASCRLGLSVVGVGCSYNQLKLTAKQKTGDLQFSHTRSCKYFCFAIVLPAITTGVDSYSIVFIQALQLLHRLLRESTDMKLGMQYVNTNSEIGNM